MASLGLLLLSTALIHTSQSLPAAYGGGRGLDLSADGVRRQRRDLRNLLPYEDQIMSYPAAQGGGRANDLYYQSDGWWGQGLDQALQRLVARDQRQEEEEQQRAAYLAAMLRLLSEVENTGLVGPGDVAVIEEEEDEEEGGGPPGDFQGPAPSDYDETGRALSMGRPPATWWGLLEPQLAQTLLDRVDPQLAQSLLDRARQERLKQTGRGLNRDQEMLRRLVIRILSSIVPGHAPANSASRRAKRDLSVSAPVDSAHRRTRRSLDDMTPPSPSNDPPLLRVKRLEEEEEEEEEGEAELGPPAAGLQWMKHVDTVETAVEEELHHGRRRGRRRAAVTFDPQILMDQILAYMRE